MADIIPQNNTELTQEVQKTSATVISQPVRAESPSSAQRFQDQSRDGKRKNVRKSSFREGRAKPEFDQKILTIRRVARVATGGRRFSFSVALVAGNRKGSVGVGIGKAGDTSLAIDKAMKDAKKNMLKIPLTKTSSIPHEIYAKYGSARVFIQPSPGRGIVAGSSVRYVIELGGIKDVAAKILSPSKNKLNSARAAVLALRNLYRTTIKE